MGTCRARTRREQIPGRCAAYPPRFPAYRSLTPKIPCPLSKAEDMPFLAGLVCFQSAIRGRYTSFRTTAPISTVLALPTAAIVEAALAGQVALALVPLWFLWRFGLTMVSYGCGAPGGIFAPPLVLGVLIGLGVGEVTHMVMPGAVKHPEAFAVVGMATYFAAIVRAPLTGIVLIVEMTNTYEQMLPLLVACFSAYVVAEAMGDRPIYEALLERDVRRGGAAPALHGTLVLELSVRSGARFDGKRVRARPAPRLHSGHPPPRYS
jgi:hypothetical protein